MQPLTLKLALNELMHFKFATDVINCCASSYCIVFMGAFENLKSGVSCCMEKS